MIRIYTDWDKVNKNDLFDEVDNVLKKRQILWDRYSRGIDFEHTGDVHYEKDAKDDDTKHLQVLFEKFIVDIAAGYLSGEISYDVDVSSDVEKRIGNLIFGKQEVTKEYAEELRYIINTLATMNKDAIEEVLLFKQALLYGSTYERIQEDDQNNYKYYNLDALNTVAIWDNSVVPKLVAVISAFEQKDENNITTYFYRVYGMHDIVVYSRDNRTKVNDEQVIKTEEMKDHNWGKVPVVVYESDFSILDKCASLISAYETLLNNVRNTYQYNDVDCKMKISGYRPQNTVMIPNPKYKEGGDQPKMIINPDRIAEDNYVLGTKTFYVQEGGDADWLTKPIDANSVTTMLKYYVDSIFQMCGIPNTADLAFNSGDLNASAIDRKFYVMNIVTASIREGIEQLIRQRFGMLLERINFKSNKEYLLDNVRITIATNLPSMTDETIDQLMRLNGIVSEETILEKLGYDYETERDRKAGAEDEDVAKATKTPRKDDEEDKEEEEGDTGGDNDSSDKESNASNEV